MTSAVSVNAAPRSPKPRATTGRRWQRITLVALAVVLVIAAACARWWGPLALSQLDYFHVRHIVIDGLRYAPREELVRSLGVDTMQSIWQATQPLAEKAETHPMIASAVVERQLPGTMVLHVVERIPVALVRGDAALRPVDLSGTVLPIDPAHTTVDAPIVQSADTVLLKLLDGLRVQAPSVYARVTEAERTKSGDVRVALGALVVRASAEVTVARFLDILPVEADLARNHLRAVELDLRFREQVIARLP